MFRQESRYTALAYALAVVTLVAIGAKLLKHYEVEGQTNALASSPAAYLQAAKYQAVNWREWGDAVFRRAKADDKPLLIDLGVIWSTPALLLNRESLTDPRVAVFINDHYVAVKVDEDERPDVAAVLRTLAFVNGLIEGQPLICTVTPDGVVYAATGYRSPEVREGFYDFLDEATKLWDRTRQSVRDDAERTELRLRELLDLREKRPLRPDASLAASYATAVYLRFDRNYGGFLDQRTEAKAVHATALLWLLERLEARDPQAGPALRLTLNTLRKSPLNDPVQGGFHMGAADRAWSIPVFGKHLAQNALLTMVYARAARLLDDPEYKRTAASTAAWLRFELWDPELSAFYTARAGAMDPLEDGAHYVWSRSQLRRVCNPMEETAATLRFGLDGPGEVSWDHTRHVLCCERSYEEIAERMGITPDEAENLVADAADKMANDPDHQSLAPPKDKSAYTDINGLAAYCLVIAGRELGRSDLVAIAQRATNRLMDLPRDEHALLPHAEGKPLGLLGDQVWAARAAVALHKETAMPEYLRFARDIADRLPGLFEDEYESWGMWQRAEDRARFEADRVDRASGREVDPRLVRDGMFPLKPIDDRFGPSENAAAALLMLDLAQTTGERKYRDAAWRILFAFGGTLGDGDPTRAGLALALQRLLKLDREVKLR